MQPSQPDPAYAEQYPAYGPPPRDSPPPGYPAPPQYAVQQPWPGYPNQVPPVGYPYQPPAPSPSAATAIIVGILSILFGLYQAFMAVIYLVMASITDSVSYDLDLTGMEWLSTFVLSLGAGSALSAIVLLVGAVLLLVRKLFARWLIAVGSIIGVVILVVPVFLAEVFLNAISAQIDEEFSLFSTGDPLAVLMIVLSIAVPLVTTVLAFLPSTRRYCQ